MEDFSTHYKEERSAQKAEKRKRKDDLMKSEEEAESPVLMGKEGVVDVAKQKSVKRGKSNRSSPLTK